jgi:hypothetical protein
VIRVAAAVLALAACAAPARAAGPDDDGAGFMGMYASLCMNHFTDLDDFRAKLLRDQVPRLPPADAQLFLDPKVEGNAWPVPYRGRMGNFVLALADHKNLCIVNARRTNAAEVERKFVALVQDAPAPLVARRGEVVERDQPTAGKRHAKAGAAGRTRTVVYTWEKPGSPRKIQFTLTTSTSSRAPLQAVGTVATVAP